MKRKFGYTLAEVLVALGIVGVLSAIMLPMINKIKPDPIKSMYIATYDAIVQATHELAANTVLYPIVDNDWNYKKAPLFNISKVKIAGREYGGDNSKFCQLLGAAFNTIDTPVCSASAVTYSDSTFKDNISFTGTNGVQFMVSTTRSNNSSDYRSEVYFDVNGNNGKNCIHSSSCKNPDRFKLIISADGFVMPGESIGDAYIRTRTDWTKRKIDTTTAGNFTEYALPSGIVDLRPVPISSGGGFYGYSCMESYIVTQGTYGDPTASCAGKTIYMETTPNEPATQAEANEACRAKGMVLPYYFQLSAAGNFKDELGLTPGDYWATPGTDNKGRVCNLPTGNCGEHNRNAKLQYRCVKPYN